MRAPGLLAAGCSDFVTLLADTTPASITVSRSWRSAIDYSKEHEVLLFRSTRWARRSLLPFLGLLVLIGRLLFCRIRSAQLKDVIEQANEVEPESGDPSPDQYYDREASQRYRKESDQSIIAHPGSHLTLNART